MKQPTHQYQEIFDKAYEGRHVQEVVHATEFFYQKAREKYGEFFEMKSILKKGLIEQKMDQQQNIFESLILDYNSFRKSASANTFGDYLESRKSNKLEYEILLTIGQLIAYIDSKAYNRLDWNEYEDKRYIARAGVYQPQWIVNLLRFKSTGNDFNSLSPVIRNALLFLHNPKERLTVLAPRHREYIARNLLNREYREGYFDADTIRFFSELGFPRELNDRANLGIVYSIMLYNQQVRSIWDETNKERLEKSVEEFDEQAEEELLKEDLEVDVEEAEKEIEEIIVSIKGAPVSQADRIAEKDLLGRTKLIDALYRMIHGISSKEGLPLTIGLFGNWGSGKSSVVELVVKKLNESNREGFRTIRFNAWKHEHVPNMAAGLAQQTVKELTSSLNFLQKLRLRLQFAFKQHFWSSLISLIGVVGTAAFLLIAVFSKTPPKETLITSTELRMESPGERQDSISTTYMTSRSVIKENMNSKEELKNDTLISADSSLSVIESKKLIVINENQGGVKALDEKVNQQGSLLNLLLNFLNGGGLALFIYFLKRLSDDPLTTKFIKNAKVPDYSDQLGLVVKIKQQIEWLTQLVLKKDQRMLVFIDDLDRCTKGSIIKTFEAIKLVMELDNTITIIAIDQRIALKAIGDYYTAFSSKNRPVADIARDYLGKIIQLPIQIGIPDPLNIEKYIQDELFKGRISGAHGITGAVKSISEDQPVSAGPENVREDFDETPETTEEQNSQQEPEDGRKIPVIAEGPSDIQETDDDDTDMEETDDEVRYFIHYTNFFRFSNPRLMRRLRNSYRILKKIESGKEGIKMLFMLFLLEYLYSRSSRTSFHEKEIKLDTDVFTDNKFNEKIEQEIIRLNIENLTDLKERTEQVVLPYMPVEM